MSGTKRKVEELGEQVLSAAVGDFVARTMSAALGRYDAEASVDEQLERLGMLVTMVHSAVDEAEQVHIASWWLRRWLWRLRDAALDGDEVLRFFRRRRAGAAAEEAAGKKTLWSAAWRALRSAKSVLFGRDDGAQRLSRALARLEREATGLGDFLKLLELEIRRSLPVRSAAPAPAGPSMIIAAGVLRGDHSPADAEDDEFYSIKAAMFLDSGTGLPPPPRRVTYSLTMSDEREEDESQISSGEDGPDSHHGICEYRSTSSIFDHALCPISMEEYAAGVRKLGLLILRQRLRRALDKLRRPAAAPPASRLPVPPDVDRLHSLVASIRRAVRDSGNVDYRCSWLAVWHSELQALVDRAELVLLRAGPAKAPRDVGVDDDEVRRTAQGVEAAAAHLEDFVTLVRFALVSCR